MYKTALQPTLTSLLSGFKTYLLTLKLSPISRKLYLSDLRRFLSSLELSSGYLSLDALTSHKLYRDYLADLRDQAAAPSMIKRTLAGLKQFGQYLALTHSIPNPMSGSFSDKLNHRSTESPILSKYIKHFINYLKDSRLSPSTIKSYKSDVSRYFDWVTALYPSTKISSLLSSKNHEKYLTYLSESGASLPTTIERKSKSLARFQAWYSSVYSPTSASDNHKSSPSTSNTDYSVNSETMTPDIEQSSVKNFYSRILFTAVLLLFTATLAIFGYRQFARDATLIAAYPSTPVVPNRQLSFQGRLENASGTPITTATNMVFKLFDASTLGTELYSSGTCSIDPDADGVFNTQIGDTCGSAIAATVFTENQDVWLEVTVAAETLDPRQQIATVAYALNSETLQGFPLSSTVSAIRNTVVPMNQWGEILVGEQSPRLTGIAGTFAISAPALSFTTASGTNGNISIAPDGTGQVNLTGNTTSTNFFNVANAQVTTGSLITGTVANANTGYKLIDLLSGSSPTSKFSVTDAGNVTLAGDLTITGGNVTSATTFDSTLTVTGDLTSNANTTIGNVNSDTLTINAGTSGTGIAFGDSSFATCTALETVGGVLTCGTDGGDGSSNWRYNLGTLSPLNDTVDLLVGANATASAKFAVLNVNSGTPTASVSAGTAGASFLTANGYLSTTARQTLTLGNSAAYDTTGNVLINPNGTGNVGIGTTTPGSKLVIHDSPTGSQQEIGTLKIVNKDDTVEFLYMGWDNTRGTYGSAYIQSIRAGTAYTPLLLNPNAGTVGIGTVGPDARLDVLATSGEQLRLTYTDGTVYSGFTVDSGGDLTIDASGGDINLAANDSLTLLAGTGALSIAGYSGTGNAGSITSSSTTDLNKALNLSQTGATVGTDYGLYATNTGAGTTNVGGYLSASGATNNYGLIVEAGYVGIGLTAPTTTLHVKGADNIAIIEGDEVEAGLATGQLRIQGATNTNKRLILGYDTTTNFGFIEAGIAGTGYSNLILNGNASGNVGIGTEGPDAVLDVLGTTEQLRLTYTDGSVYSGFTVASDGELTIANAGTDADITINPGGSLIFADLNCSTNANGGALTADATGVVSCTDDDSGGGSGSSNWRYNLGTLSPLNDTVDLLVGANATDSAKFAVLNVNSGTPTASVSAGVAGAAFLTATGNLQTTAKQALTLAGGNSGDIFFHGTTFKLSTTGDLTLGGRITFENAEYVENETNGTVNIGTTILGLVGGTSLVTDQTSFDLFNTTTTTLNVAGAATTLNLGAGGALTRTINVGTGTGADTINIGTGGTTADAINIGGLTTTQTNFTGDVNFAGGTTYYVDESGNAKFNDIIAADTGNPGLTVGDGTTGFIKVGSSTIMDNATTYLGLDPDSDTVAEFVFSDAGLFGIGTLNPDYMAEIVSSGTTGLLELTGDSITTGTGINISLDGLSIGTGFYLESTSTALSTGGLASYYWNPGSATTASGDIFKINIGANATLTGDIFTVQDNGSDLFKVQQSGITSALPHAFTAAGDVSVAYDLILNNQTASKIEAYGPLTIEAGESFENNDLTLKTYGTGALVVDAVGGSEFTRSGGTVATFNRTTSDGTIVSLQQAGTEEGTISVSTTTVSYNAFTGSHYTWLDSPVVPDKGELVSFTNNNGRLHNRPESEILYGIKKTAKQNDSQVLGMYLAKLEPGLPDSASNPHLVMAVGNADLWVTDTGKPIQTGDRLISSSVPGHAETDPGLFDVTYVVARAAEPVDWSKVTETTPNGVKHKRISVLVEPHTIDRKLSSLLTLGDNGQLTSFETIYNTDKSLFASLANIITSLQDRLLALESEEPVSPLAFPSELTGPLTITPLPSTEPGPLLIVDGEIEAASISARLAKLDEIKVDKLTAGDIVADSITANSIVGLDAKIATLSAGLTDDELSTITDRIKARIQELSGSAPTATEIPLEDLDPDLITDTLEASESSNPKLVDLEGVNIYPSLSADFVSVNDYLAVIGQATITTLDVTNTLYTETINAKSGTLALQPLGGIVKLAGDTLIADSSGNVTINGNLNVTGELRASSLLGNLLEIYDEGGSVVGSIDASGSATLASLTTQIITIASSSDASGSATPSALAQTLGFNVESNATAGTATLVAPNTELVISSPHVASDTLVYLTPTTNTDNKVLFVKSKNTCVQSSELPNSSELPCNPGFTVGIDTPASTDISFNWWIIRLQP